MFLVIGDGIGIPVDCQQNETSPWVLENSNCCYRELAIDQSNHITVQILAIDYVMVSWSC